MRSALLVGLCLLTLPACNKSKGPDAVAEDGEELHPGGERGGRFRRMCEGEGAEAHLAKMQKCQSETHAACNTQVFGTATPTKDQLCGDREKMRSVMKCVREKFGGDRDKMKAERGKMRECMGGE